MITTMSRPHTYLRTATGNSYRRLIAACLAGILALALAATAQAQDLPAQPSAAQSARPPQVDLTKSDRNALTAAQGKRRQMAGSGLYMLLAKAADMEPMADDQWALLDHVAYPNLISQPEGYTGRPIRLRVYVQVAQKLTAGDTLGITPDWRQGRVAWRIDAIEADSPRTDKYPTVRLFSVIDPTDIFGKPIRQDGEELVYAVQGGGAGPYVEVAALFYKTWEAESRDAESLQIQFQDDGAMAISPGVTQVPVLVVWDMRPAQGFGRSSLETSQTIPKAFLAITILVMLAIIFYLLKRTVRRRRKTDALAERIGHGGYKPLRDIEMDDEPETPRDEEDEAVDPDLAAAAEAYRREREQETPDA